MSTFEDFIRPLAPARTGDPSLDGLIERLETRTNDGALAELAATKGAGPALLARLEQTAATFGAIDTAAQAERSIYEQVWAAQQSRHEPLGRIARATAAQAFCGAPSTTGQREAHAAQTSVPALMCAPSRRASCNASVSLHVGQRSRARSASRSASSHPPCARTTPLAWRLPCARI